MVRIPITGQLIMPSKFINILLEVIMVRDISDFYYLCAHVCVWSWIYARAEKSKWNMVWINKFPMYYWIYYTTEEKENMRDLPERL